MNPPNSAAGGRSDTGGGRNKKLTGRGRPSKGRNTKPDVPNLKKGTGRTSKPVTDKFMQFLEVHGGSDETMMQIQEVHGGTDEKFMQIHEDYSYSYRQSDHHAEDVSETCLPVNAWKSILTVDEDARDEVIANAPSRIKNSSPLEWVTVYQVENPSNLTDFMCLYDEGSTRSLLDSTVGALIGRTPACSTTLSTSDPTATSVVWICRQI